MKKFLSFLVFATLLFTSCGGDQNNGGDEPTPEPTALSVKISGLVESYQSASVKIIATGAKSYAYKVTSNADALYDAESIFADGVVGKCSQSGATTFTISNLQDNTDYTLWVAVTSAAGELSDVVTREFRTKMLEEFTVVSKTQTEIKALVRLPKSVPSTSVVKWAVTDLATYNHNGGEAGEELLLNRDERIYGNYFTDRIDLDINEQNRTFTKDGVTYSHYEPITAGMPVVLLLAEYAEGSHSEWGKGFYSPFYGSHNSSGYYRKELIVTSKPASVNQKPTIDVNLLPSGKGSVKVSVPKEIVGYHYLLLDKAQFAQAMKLINNNESYMQWFVTTSLAAQMFGAKQGKGDMTIDASTLSFSNGNEYRLYVTAFGSEDGSKQSFATATLVPPPSAPLPANNIVIAHRGGSKEGGVPDNSIASLKYAMGLGCYASETDIYWTKDNQIIVAHADNNCKINGLYPWEHTLAEIQAAGRLSNGEIVPSLQDYIRAAMVKGSCTKVCLDIKAIEKPTAHHAESIKACQRACEIIAEMEAQNFCQFICTGYAEVLSECTKYTNAIGVEIGAMGNHSASKYKSWGYKWHNRDFTKYGATISQINGYLNAGMEVSVFTIDNDSQWSQISTYAGTLKGITTNYPRWLLAKF